MAQVVVLGHAGTGKFVVVANEQASRAKASQRADARQTGGGWTTLVSSTMPGHGAMFCFRSKGGDVRFFPVEGKTSSTEAIASARAQANAATRGSGAFTSICGTWNNLNAYPMEALATAPDASGSSTAVPRASDDPGLRKDGQGGLIDAFKGEVRERVTCDPKRAPCPPPRKSTAVGVRG